MALGLERPWALLLWPVFALLLLWLARLTRPRSRLALPIRLLMLTLLVLGLAAPNESAPAPVTARRVILVDRSASMNPDAVEGVRQQLLQAGFSQPDTLVVQFAAQPTLVGDWAKPWPPAPGNALGTNLGAALDLAGDLLAGQAGSVVLISDGEATQGEAQGAAERLAAAGIVVDVWPMEAAPVENDVAVLGVTVPDGIWTAEPYSVTVALYALRATTTTLSVSHDGQPLADVSLSLAAGDNSIVLSAAAGEQGLTAFEARTRTPGDARPENDFGAGLGYVRAAPRVLIVAAEADAGEALRAILLAHQIGAEVRAPKQLPPDSVDLQPYQVVVLTDMSTEGLTLEQLAALEGFVRNDGRGLIVTGGPHSYPLGAYNGTVLERMLPVTLEPPDRTERKPANLLLILDQSGSMAGDKLALAREAAMRAVEILQPEDRVGVIVFDDAYEWLVPFATVGEGLALRDVLDKLSQIGPKGGTEILEPLRIGLQELAALPPGSKHVVLLTDGQSVRGAPDDFRQIVQAAILDNITVSTVAVGFDADLELLQSIATWGQGRFHFAENPDSIPRLMLAESESVRSEFVQRGEIQALIAGPHALVSTFQAPDLPPLQAYLALLERPAEEADVILWTPLDDPLLSTWQYGLGRVVAWTSDISGVWTPAWQAWPDFGRFWTQMVRYALPDPTQEALLVQAHAVGSAVAVNLLAIDADRRNINLASGQVVFAAPDGSFKRVDLAQTGPGEYQVTFAAPGPGAYRAVVLLDKQNQHWEVPVGFVASYPPEFNSVAVDGQAALTQIAALTGGREVHAFGSGGDEPAPVGRPARVEYAQWLVIAALAFWPLEIAIRRQWMPWR